MTDEKFNPAGPGPIYTVGHSTRSIEEFLAILSSFGIATLADIRRFPGSRRHPHFSSDALARSLASAGIDYLHIPELGGRRTPLPDSKNAGWRNDSFRAYADHMHSAEFARGLARVFAAKKPVVLMCAEAVPWRCHRNLVSDALVAKGITVLHISSASESRPHVLTPFARVAPDGTVTYPSAEPQGSLF